MEWEMVRARGEVDEPSLTEMTRQAITKLQRSKAGFVLMVEGGRIDHAHHKNQAKKALVETLELERAVEAALSLTRREETLIIVTADHRFVFFKPRRPKGEKKIAKLFFSGVAFQTICPVIYVQKMGQK